MNMCENDTDDWATYVQLDLHSLVTKFDLHKAVPLQIGLALINDRLMGFAVIQKWLILMWAAFTKTYLHYRIG